MTRILYVNACCRKESRTHRLAEYLLEKLEGTIEEVNLTDWGFVKTDEAYLAFRDACIAKGDYSAPMFSAAKQFAEADIIVMAAPFWDLSFPAVVKRYIEMINVLGIAFVYTEDGYPKGLCRAKKLFYVTTAGGPLYCEEFGYGYIKELAKTFYGIPQTKLIKAENLDIVGMDAEDILQEAERRIDKMLL